jgi:hypothetical protein
MRRALLAAGAVVLFAAPALADELTVDKKTVTTTTTTRTPEVGSTVSTVIIAPTPPPPPRVEVPPPVPGPDMAWIPGHWRWSRGGQNYVWDDGRYAEPPRARAAWMAGHFERRPDGWIWTEGHWD